MQDYLVNAPQQLRQLNRALGLALVESLYSDIIRDQATYDEIEREINQLIDQLDQKRQHKYELKQHQTTRYRFLCALFGSELVDALDNEAGLAKD